MVFACSHCIQQILEAVLHCHQMGVVHRDLKVSAAAPPPSRSSIPAPRGRQQQTCKCFPRFAFPFGSFIFDLASPPCKNKLVLTRGYLLEAGQCLAVQRWAVQGEQKVLFKHCVYSLNTWSSSVSCRAFGTGREGNFPFLISRIWSASGKHRSLYLPCILVTEGQSLWDCRHTDLSPLQIMAGLQNVLKKQEFLQCSYHTHLWSPVPSR